MPSIQDQKCLILSMVFLDTEISEMLITGMALRLHELGTKPEELTDLVYYNLFPILFPNLLSVAGEWTGFDEGWLLQQMHNRQRTETNFLICIFRIFDYIPWLLFSAFVRRDIGRLERALEEHIKHD
ncbi:hypothetical protein GGR51DRAFT_530906 [Nemania sp. FL0031]|nr:hypothetical protein GGR51DRAFT_530906 [Nemania sp. FL0031]